MFYSMGKELTDDNGISSFEGRCNTAQWLPTRTNSADQHCPIAENSTGNTLVHVNRLTPVSSNHRRGRYGIATFLMATLGTLLHLLGRMSAEWALLARREAVLALHR